MSIESLMSSPVGIRMLDDLVSRGYATRPIAELSEADLYDLVARAAVEVSAERFSAAPGRNFPWQQRASADDVERLARELPKCAAARWWSGTVADRPQVWLGPPTATPTSGVVSAEHAGKPPHALFTSSAVAGLPSAWWPVLRKGADHPPPTVPQSIWRVTPTPDARVFEIRTPADWRRLCDTFPAPHADGTVGPDWKAAGERFDGMHVTVEGLIGAQGVGIETDHGVAMLDAWDAESTAWLRWSFTAVERLGFVAPD